MKKQKMLTWTVEFSVSDNWVADGFDLTDERALDMLTSDLRFAYSDELKAKVTKTPSKEQIAKLQGYKSVKDMERDNK